MNNITEKTAYLKGLCDGLKLDTEKPEGKLISEIIKALDDIAAEVSNLGDRADMLNDYIEEVDEDLGDVEEYLFDEDDDDDYDEEDDEDDEDCYEVVCPSCGETVCFDASIDPDNLICPACNRKIECISGNCSGDCAGCGSSCDSEQE